jgi:hypothetical protein
VVWYSASVEGNLLPSRPVRTIAGALLAGMLLTACSDDDTSRDDILTGLADIRTECATPPTTLTLGEQRVATAMCEAMVDQVVQCVETASNPVGCLDIGG